MGRPKDDKQNDQALLERLADNDSLAFDAIYDRYWDLIYGAAYKRVPDEEIARDIVQDIFLQLWVNREKLRIVNLAAYLYTAVRNRVFKHFARSKRFVPIPELMDQLLAAEDQADASVIRKEFIVHYESLVVKLTKGQQEIFKMRFDEDLSTIEIAERLQIKRKTVHNQLGRSIAQLRDVLGLWVLWYWWKIW